MLLTPWALERPYVWAELGAAWGRRIPIVALLQGITPAELQTRPGIPVLLKKRDPGTLPFDLRLRRYVIKQTPEETADELSHSLSAA